MRAVRRGAGEPAAAGPDGATGGEVPTAPPTTPPPVPTASPPATTAPPLASWTAR
ncbi:hypothetical protein [Kribbella sp. DT2]|uniref:hypothetical protein n=1 Tax=Kribbella sp. DT2 TaxID=3393427 RepID=UPI003CFAC316